jgi:hypothetical protein
LVAAPPVPTLLTTTEPNSKPARSSPNATVSIGSAPGSLGGRVYRHSMSLRRTIGPDQLGDECGEAVVVAEADLVRRDGVVLVHDRQDAQAEQTLHRSAGIGAVRGVLEVTRSQQHLAGHDREGRRAS